MIFEFNNEVLEQQEYISNTEEVIENASKDYEVVVTDPYHLLLDLDTPEDFQYALEQLKIFKGGSISEVWKSKSGVGRHMVIELSSPITSPMERIALQAALGSDRKRELLAIDLVKQGTEKFSFLFKPKMKKEE